jgi:hypothetical protein
MEDAVDATVSVMSLPAQQAALFHVRQLHYSVKREAIRSSVG